MTLEMEKIYQIYAKTARIYQQALEEPNNPGLNYLEKRGFNKEYLEKYSVGFAPKDATKTFMLKTLIQIMPVYQIIEAKIAKVDLEKFYIKDSIGSQRVVFPLTINNQICGFSARTILNSVTPKYKTILPKEGLPIINSEILYEDHKEIFISEGWIDTHTLNMNGIPVIGTLGANNISINHKKILEPFKGIFIFIFDQEEGNQGNLAVKRTSNVLFRLGYEELYYVKLPFDKQKMDVNKLYLKYPHRFNEIVLNLQRYKLFPDKSENKQTKKYNLNLPNLSIFDIISKITELKSTSNGKYVCRCPFPDHNDSNPSFHIRCDEGFNYFYCFGCGRHGGPISFLKHYYNVNSIDEAISRWKNYVT